MSTSIDKERPRVDNDRRWNKKREGKDRCLHQSIEGYYGDQNQSITIDDGHHATISRQQWMQT